MLLRGRKKVHITAVGVEVNRVVIPILEIGADRVILIENLVVSKEYTPFIDAVEEALRKRCPNCSMERVRMDLFDIEKLIGKLGKLITKERQENNQIFLNVSAGSRLYDAAGVIAASMFGAIAYYAEAKSYWQDISIYFDKKGIPRGTVKDIKYTIEIPQFSIKPPKVEWIRFLAILNDRIEKGHKASQSMIAKDLQDRDLLSKSDKDAGALDNRETIRMLSEQSRRGQNGTMRHTR